MDAIRAESKGAVDLYWLPLGAGGHFVRLNGRIYEALAAWHGKRPRRALYHSALAVTAPAGVFVVEQAWPIPRGDGTRRGVVAQGVVGTKGARSLRFLRYEIRRWRDGVIADVGEAVASPQRLTDDAATARRLLELVPAVPTPVWGRDEHAAGEMWNSNSLISWLIARSGLDVDSVQPPSGGRAPCWDAGVVVARRNELSKEGGFDAIDQGRSISVPGQQEGRGHRRVAPAGKSRQQRRVQAAARPRLRGLRRQPERG
jgi:hypothetical protein